MAEEAGGKSPNLEEVLKPFYQRASEVEGRLAKLEALLARKGNSDAEDKEITSLVKDFQSKLEIAQAELMNERDKASKELERLQAENMKLYYRNIHLMRAIAKADSELEALQMKFKS